MSRNITNADRKRLNNIYGYLSKASDEFGNLSEEVINDIQRLHDEDSSLLYCLRWGQQAAKDAKDEFNN